MTIRREEAQFIFPHMKNDLGLRQSTTLSSKTDVRISVSTFESSS